jgi:hypothetical protein
MKGNRFFVNHIPSLAYRRCEEERNDVIDVGLVRPSPDDYVCPPNAEVGESRWGTERVGG